MKSIKLKEWVILVVLAVASCFIWHRYAYPTFTFINFSVDRDQAMDIARTTLNSFEPDADQYYTAAVFIREGPVDRYLQKNLGFNGLLNFVRTHDFDMFVWDVRFFKEGEREEYRFSISAATGEVTAFRHKIEDTVATKTTPKEALFDRSINFLHERFDFDPDNYELKTDLSKNLPNRQEYLFSWDKKDVAIPWTTDTEANKAYLANKIIVSGEEVLGFSKNILRIPEDFNRSIDRRKITGKNLMAVMRVFYYLLFMSAIFFIFSRTNHLATHCTKRFYIRVFIFALFITIIDNINSIQHILIHYNTTSPLNSFMYRKGIENIMSAFLLCGAMIIPALAGESLRLETNKKHHDASFLHYIYSSFFTRHVAKLILLGYLVTIIMFGLQSSLFEFGRTYLGVWQEQTWKSQFMTSYYPFITAFTHAFKSSITEEFVYRLFAIHFFTKIFKRTWIAVVLSSLIWGFAHTSYPIFPMWFRGLEMSVIGIFMGIVYVRFGIIPVIIGHFLFNLCWHTVGYIFGNAGDFYLYSSLAVLSIPLMWALLAWILNQGNKERPLKWVLNPAQQFNAEVLQTYLKAHAEKYRGRDPEELKKEISSKGWDYAVVDRAVDDHSNPVNDSE